MNILCNTEWTILCHSLLDIIRISPGQKVSIPDNNFHYQSQPLSLDWKIDYNLPKEYYKTYMPLLNLNSLRGEVNNLLYTSKDTHIDFINDISFHYKNWNTKLSEMGASEKEVKDNMRALYQLEFIDKSQAYSDLIRSPWVSYQSHDLDRTLEFLHKQLKEVKSKLGDVKYPSRSYSGFNQYFRDERDLPKYYTYDYAIKTYGHYGIRDKKILDPPGKIGGFLGGALGSLFTIAITITFPIGVDLNGDGLCLVGLDYTTALYDMDGDGVRDKIGWVCEDDALLVFDINNDNEIIEPKEINFKIWSDKASSDLDGLKLVFDTNKDGKIDEVDQNFHLFKIWQDKNQNGMSEIGELSTLKEAGISSIMLYESVSKITKWHLGVETDDIRTIEAVKINWINNKGGAAYDLGFPYKPVPPQIEQYSIDFEELSIESNAGEILKIFLQEGVETNVIDLSNNNYKIFIGDHFNNSVITGNQGAIVDVGIGNNMVLGGAGNDWIKGEGYIDAGDGNDLVFMNKNGDINGGKGFDTLFIPPSIDGYNYSFHNTTNFESLISLACKEEYDFSSYSSSMIFEFICFNGNDQMSLKSTNNSEGDIIRITSGANDIKLYCKKDDEVYLNSLIGLYSLNKYLNPAEGNIIVFGAKKLIIKSEEKESNINPVNVTNVIVSGNHIKLKNHDGKQAPNFILSDTRILELEKLSDTIFFLSNGSILKMEGCEENKIGKCTYLIDHNTRDLVIEQNSIAKYVHNYGKYYGDFSIGYLFLHSNIKLEELYFDGTPMDLSLKRHTKDGDINVITIKFRDEKIYSKICNPADRDAYNQLTAEPAIGKVVAYINIDKPNELRHISLLGKGCVEYDGHWQKVKFINGLTKWQDNVGHGVTALAAGGSDKMTGTNFADYINGGSGCDKIHGRGGNDIILGGKGDDHLEGGAGDDTYIYFWGDGNDVIKDFEEYIHNDRTVKYRNGGDDTILFGYGIKPEHIKIKLAPVKRDKWDPFCSKECSQKGNIIITIEDEMRYLHGNQDHTDGKIEIRNSDCCGMIEHIEFMDGWPTMHL